MRSRFTESLDPFGAFTDRADAEFYMGNSPLRHGGNPPANTPVQIPSSPALTSEAAASLAAQSGPTSTVSLVSGGITINLLFDAAAMAAPASFRAGVQQAAALLTAAISDPITVNIKIDYSGSGGGAAAGPDDGLYESYSTVRSNLINHATPGDTTFNALPAGSSIQGQTNVAVWNAQLKLWGIVGANDTTTDDGSATFATDINPNLLVGVALHELTHALGRINYGPQPDVLDLFRFTSAGVRLFSGAATAGPAYFSLDGGNTKLADYGRTSDPSDFLNSGVQGANDPFNEFYNGSTIQALSAADKTMLDALGFHTMTPVTTVIEAFGATSLTEIGSNFYLKSNSDGSGPALQLGGATYVAGQIGAWAPIGTEQTAGGYEVAWKYGAADQYIVWNTDTGGNLVSYLVGVVSGNSSALQALETSFHQDLNGDGTIGVPVPTVVESFGATSLTELGSNFYLKSNSNGSGPALQLGGATYVAGQIGAWTPIGTEQTAGGYEVAWKYGAGDQYVVWNTDSGGNLLSYLVGVVSGSSIALQAAETSFHQDLNGDGTIGISAPATHVIESFGATSLTEVGSNFYLKSNSDGSGPALQFGSAPYVAGQIGAWTPIAAEHTAGGYEVAWKYGAADQYVVWNTDSGGNLVSYLVGVVSGSSSALQALETSFHQDLNGDGTIGVSAPATNVVEAFGATSLTEVGSNFYLKSNSDGSGPALQLGGATYVAGQIGAWTPIGTEQTAGGYEVAWKYGAGDQYVVWNTDSGGNLLSYLVGAVSGSSSALQALETSFHQDLNGDGTIGVSAHTTPSSILQPAALVEASKDSFVFANGRDSSVFANAPAANLPDTHTFQSPGGNDLTALLGDLQARQLPPAFHVAGDGHETGLSAEHHDLHGSGLFIV